MVARPWSSSRLSCGERLLLRCDGNAGNSFPNTQGKDASSRARSRKRSPLDVGGTLVLPLERRDPFPAWWGKNSPRSRRISSGRALDRKRERNSRVVPPFPESTDVSVHSRETCFPCTARLSCRVSTHTTVARGTALWESLVGKPRGKAPDNLIHAKGSVTLLLQLGRKASVFAPTRYED